MLPATTERVPRWTAEHVNQKIEDDMIERLEYYARYPQEIDIRMRELDEEWDTERTLEANAASISMLGLALAGGVSKKWLLLPAVVCGFLLQHALQGWCPPLPVIRRMGVRTQTEIQTERYALKILRGDFVSEDTQAIPSGPRMAYSALESVRR